MRNKICAGNWKLNKSPQETTEFIQALFQSVKPEWLPHYALFPSTICLSTLGGMVNDSGLQWGPQNVFTETEGAFTGETSVEVVSHLNATHVLIGHSERRTLFSESNEDIAKKVQLTQKFGMIPMVCVGETLKERDAGDTNKVLTQQLVEGLKLCSSQGDVVIAYEPVWAIGTGKVATPDIAEAAHKHIREVLSQIWDEERAQSTSLLYGGSVKPDNAMELSRKENIDGFLIGGASLNVDSFVQIGDLLLS
ncbi:MAG: triose-phosphate isomerase [Bdellovibrionales bacterium]|nr:triose-phosphate isomerase [Bdellovibrionales bacterium]